MLVAQILKTKGEDVFRTTPDRTLAEAADQLHRRRVGAVVVTGADGRVAGIFSERDLVRAVAESGGEALGRPVGDFMSADVVFADPRETVDALLSRMTDRRIRHLPVCRDDVLVGIVSIGDLVKAKIAEAEAEAEHLKSYIAAG